MSTAIAAGESRVEALLSRMTAEEKVGQMVMAGFPTRLAESEARILIEQRHVGGIILFSRNLSDPSQSAHLANELQKMATSSGAGIPLFISADQEGGYVSRVPGASAFPGNMGLGAAGDPALARRVAEATARELRACGINMNFAPVVDVNSNPSNPVIGIRSFGESPEAVARLGVATIEGLQKEGVIATAKHFPGHGDTSLDSHIDLPTVPHDRARLREVELKPFQAAIDRGVDAVMTAHVTFPAFEPRPSLPATLSRNVLTGLLRQEMGFKGLIVTDAMEMGAIVKNFGLEEAAVMAVNAGADMVLVGWPKEWYDAVRVIDALIEAVKARGIPMARVDQSVRRILAIKERRGVLAFTPLDTRKAKDLVGSAAGRRLALEAARRSICLVRDSGGLIPLGGGSAGKVLVVTPDLGRGAMVEEPSGEPATLAAYLKPTLKNVSEIVMSANPDANGQSAIVDKSQAYDTVIVLTSKAWAPAAAGQAAVASAIADRKSRVIAVSLREPYDLRKYSRIGTYLAAFNASPVAMEALADVLLGEFEPQATLPVRIPGLYPVGHRM